MLESEDTLKCCPIHKMINPGNNLAWSGEDLYESSILWANGIQIMHESGLTITDKQKLGLLHKTVDNDLRTLLKPWL
ncbi:hypothetical protein BJX65DRAFT_263903, partial [Aspergillus insuetus]